VINKNELAGKVVAITGASGYIGSALTLELNKYSVKIVRVSRTKLPPIEGIKDLVLDLNIASSWIKIVSEVDIIFHLSGNASLNYAEKNPKESLKSTLLPISQLISASRELCRSPTVVFSSTATVYGLTNEFPVVESIKPNPISTYDLNKLFAEQELYIASQKNIINSINLRLANVYGPSLTESRAENRGIINRITRMKLEGKKIQIYGDGNNIRDYVYIDDVVNAFLHASIIDSAENIFNVSSGIGTRVNQAFSLICAEIEKQTGIIGAVEYIDWPKGTHEIDKRNFIGSSERLQSLSRWSPSISLEEGIKLLVNYYNKELINDSVS
jgi:UDP-glucose 4-epimerase